MNLAINATGFREPSYHNFDVNLNTIKGLVIPNDLSNIILHGATHLLDQNSLVNFLKDIYEKLSKDGLLTIWAVDLYEICHKVHRRDILDAEFQQIMYNDKKNCFSALQLCHFCDSLGFKKKSVSWDNEIWVKLEFTK